MQRITVALISGLLSLPATAIAQQKTELMVGWLGYSDGMIHQELGIRNNALRPIKIVTIGCSFSHDEKRLGAGSVSISNIDPDAAKYASLSMHSSSSPDRAACRIISERSAYESDGVTALLRGVARTRPAETDRSVPQAVDRYR